MNQLTRPNSLETMISVVISDLESKHSRRVYSAELERFFSWYEEHSHLYPEGFSRHTVLAYRDGMREAKRGAVSINLALSAIRKLARIAADAGMMQDGQAGRIDAVQGVPRDTRKRLGNWLSLEDLKMLLAAPPPTTPNRGLRDRTALWIMGACGLRREEAASLKLKNLQIRDGRPALVDFVGKGNKMRSAGIHALADAAIRRWCAHAGIVDPEAYLLPTFSNPDTITTKQADGARLYTACKRYCAAFSCDFRPHDLRRTFAVLAKKGGADLDEIRAALGHSSVTTTEVYLRGPMSMESAAADRIKL